MLWRWPRIILILTIVAALLGGLSSGLARQGLPMDSLSTYWMAIHGPLMIAGFLGTLISLERAVALVSRYPWSMVVPFVNALGVIGLLVAPQSVLPRVGLFLGSIGLVVSFGVMLRLHPSRDVAIMALGALALLLANGLWLFGSPVFVVVHLWVAFLVLTIVGERLELSRVLRLSPLSQNLLLVAIGVYAAGSLLTVAWLDAGIRLLGIGAVLLAAWLLRYDIATRTIHAVGLPRYIGFCLLLGYFWLAVGGVIGIWQGAVVAGPFYAAMLHAFLLGFTFSMIFGHAPIILPALTGLSVTYWPVFYGPLVLLHLTLLIRFYGYFTLDLTIQRWGSVLNVTAILLFMGLMLVTVISANWQPTRQHPA